MDLMNQKVIASFVGRKIDVDVVPIRIPQMQLDQLNRRQINALILQTHGAKPCLEFGTTSGAEGEMLQLQIKL